jgi:hypothetical protein
LEKDDVTTTIEVIDILPGDPPQIVMAERLGKPGKSGRLFLQTVAVPDTSLFARLTAQVRKGDAIEATVTTEWYENGYSTYLSDFAQTQNPCTESEKGRGSRSIAQGLAPYMAPSHRKLSCANLWFFSL